MTKIKICAVNKDYAKGMFEPMYRASKELHDFGYEIVNSGENLTFIQLYSHLPYEQIQPLIDNAKTPVILVDAAASSGYNWLEFAEQDKVIGYLKKSIYKDKFLYLKWWPRMRYHYYLIMEKKIRDDGRNGNPNWFEHKQVLNYSVLNKLYLAWNIGLIDRNGINFYDDFEEYDKSSWILHSSFLTTININVEANRLNDIEHPHPNDYDIPYIQHRLKCFKIVENIRKKGKIKVSPICQGKEYNENLMKSFACISPWGKGENCFRTFEAIKYGSIVICPNMSHMNTWPNIYRSWHSYVPCKPDFSDLEEIVESIHSHYLDYDSIPRNAYAIMKSCWKPKVFANYFDSLMNQIGVHEKCTQ